MTTVNIYKNGTVLIQGNINHFQTEFKTLKTAASKEASSEGETGSALKISSEEGEQPSPAGGAPNTEQGPSPPDHHLILLKEHFTHLEVELVQLRETVLKQQPEKTMTENEDNRKQLQMLKKQIKELQKDRDTYKKDLNAQNELLKELQKDKGNRDVIRKNERKRPHFTSST